jgi:hypothetical protein
MKGLTPETPSLEVFRELALSTSKKNKNGDAELEETKHQELSQTH